MTDIRNARQVDAVYERLGKTGKANDPYVLEYESGSQLLIFFGARHSNDPADSQWFDLEKRWQSFVSHGNDKKVVCYEQGPLEIGLLSKKEALQQDCESGLVVWLANKAGVAFEWAEPDRISQVKHLKSRGYSEADIMIYYFTRQMMQWVTRDKINQADWHKYAAKTIASYNSLGCWENTLTFDLIIDWYKQVTGKDFDPEDMKTIYSLCDPSQSKVSEVSGEFRDITLLGAITSHWQQKNDIFVIYGSGHAIALEPALREITKLKND